MKLNAGVIGVGNMGRHHVRNYHEIPAVNLVAVADSNAKAAKDIAERYHCHYYTDYRQLLEKEPIEVVSIAVPTNLHKKVALDCIDRKINILIEKPIALNVPEAKEIVYRAKQKGIKFTVGHIERFNPSVLKLKELIDHDKLGELVMIATVRLGPMSNQIKDANVVVDIGVHDIDIMNWFFGRLPEKISARSGRALHRTHEDHVEAFLSYGNGTGLLMANWITPLKVRKLTVSGKKAYVELNYITQELDFYETIAMPVYDDFGDFMMKFSDGQGKKIIPVKNIEPLKAEILSFVDCIRKNCRPMVTAREAIEALDIAHKINRMIR